jgi:hypothetical protein
MERKPIRAVIVIVSETAIVTLLFRIVVRPPKVDYFWLIPLTLVAASLGVSTAVRTRGKKWFEESLRKWRTNPFQWG